MQNFADDLRAQVLSPSTVANIVDPLRVIFRRGHDLVFGRTATEAFFATGARCRDHPASPAAG
jgi:hypothetical protein